ncbi:hypothetical protein LMG24238_00867 [Paraburkholderia sediminicola]|uniref:PASTA domain-containing protein n=1 Tax=Paraburkholderia sediminicola TaxID=458836 RepID=A0A6J4ZYA7_9BURK|nr:PASTA domain-containing protein [Paraburkholderia sediminicola]CAB3647427.1 hypothetical protein LMG24238_00867 [Paraburkholderia sediminicola]
MKIANRECEWLQATARAIGRLRRMANITRHFSGTSRICTWMAMAFCGAISSSALATYVDTRIEPAGDERPLMHVQLDSREQVPASTAILTRPNTRLPLTYEPQAAGQRVQVPQIEQSTVAVARERVEAVGLRLRSFDGRPLDDAAVVILQRPPALTPASANSFVTVVKVQAPPPQPQSPAVASESAPVPAVAASSQTPPSTKPQITQVPTTHKPVRPLPFAVVPKVLGMTLDVARSTVDSAGLRVVPDVDDGDEVKRRVIRQRPNPDMQVSPGSPVEVDSELILWAQLKKWIGIAVLICAVVGVALWIRRSPNIGSQTIRPGRPDAGKGASTSPLRHEVQPPVCNISATLTHGPDTHTFRGKAPEIACPSVNVRLDGSSSTFRITEPRAPFSQRKR